MQCWFLGATMKPGSPLKVGPRMVTKPFVVENPPERGGRVAVPVGDAILLIERLEDGDWKVGGAFGEMKAREDTIRTLSRRPTFSEKRAIALQQFRTAPPAKQKELAASIRQAAKRQGVLVARGQEENYLAAAIDPSRDEANDS